MRRRLPRRLLVLRSSMARVLGLALRCIEPVRGHAWRFVCEAWARARIRGNVEAGVQFFGLVTVVGTGRISIGAGTRIGRRVYLETQEDGEIGIGRDVVISDGVTIVSYAKVAMGDYAMVGEYASIRDANHGIRLCAPIRTQRHDAEAVEIGEDAWIGRGACVLKGVRIGDGAVVGANSAVTHDVAPRVIVAGTPARPIGERKP